MSVIMLIDISIFLCPVYKLELNFGCTVFTNTWDTWGVDRLGQILPPVMGMLILFSEQ